MAQKDTAKNDNGGNLGFETDLFKADYILANPPFNIHDWGGERLRDNVRRKFGTPPVGNANGSTFQEISKSNFRPLRVIVPSDPVLASFKRSAGPLYRQMMENERESHSLIQLRDTVLPKLISGELRVPDAKRILGETEKA